MLLKNGLIHMLGCSLIALEAALYLQIMGVIRGMKETHWGDILHCTEILLFASLKNMNSLTQTE